MSYGKMCKDCKKLDIQQWREYHITFEGRCRNCGKLLEENWKCVDLTCRVCERVEEVSIKGDDDDEDYVCGVCSKLEIFDKSDLQEWLCKKCHRKEREVVRMRGF